MSEITGLAVGWINQVLTQGITQRKREQLQRAENAFSKLQVSCSSLMGKERETKKE